MKASNSIESWFSDNVEIRKSSIAGTGLFAKHPLRKDEVVAVKGGHIVPKRVFLKLSTGCQRASLQISETMYVSPIVDAEIPKVMNYVNHSCEPNLGLRGHLLTVAMRDIDEGEELTADYCIAYTEREFEIECNCGAKDCRKHIRSDDWENKKLQKKYKGYFCQYLSDRINAIGM